MTASDWLATVANHKQQQALHIGRAAAELALEHGISAVTMSALARDAGISRATLYNYVPDVATAISLYLKAQGEVFRTHVETAIEEEPDPRRKLRRYISEQVAFVATPDHQAAAALMNTGLRGQTGAHEERAPDLLVGILRQGIADGSFDAAFDAEALAMLITRLLYSAHELLVVRQMSEQDVRDMLLSLICDGIDR